LKWTSRLIPFPTGPFFIIYSDYYASTVVTIVVISSQVSSTIAYGEPEPPQQSLVN